MKNFKAFVFVAIMSVAQVNAVDIPKTLEWCGQKTGQYSKSLLKDTTTQITTLSSVITCIGCYKYYNYQAALVCLDGHFNSKIMHKSNLINMTYSDFLNMLASAHSYAETLSFMDKHCTTCFSLSDLKINRFVALINDLQGNNINQASNNAEAENMILENFKNQLILAQDNIKQELINGAINANKNANNAITARLVLDILNSLFGSK